MLIFTVPIALTIAVWSTIAGLATTRPPEDEETKHGDVYTRLLVSDAAIEGMLRLAAGGFATITIWLSFGLWMVFFR